MRLLELIEQRLRGPSMNTNKKNRLVVLLALFVVLGLAFLLAGTVNKNNTASAKLATANSEYKKLGQTSSKDLMSAPDISESSDVNKAKDKVRQFASTYFTYKDANSYLKRQANLSGITKLSDDDTNTLFNSDNQRAQIDRINNLNLRSEYKNVLSSSVIVANSNNIELVSVVSVSAGGEDLGMKSQKVILH